MAETLKIPREQLRPLDHRVSYLDPRPLDVEYRLAEQKNLFNSATFAFHQTWLNVPVWAAGLTVTLEQAPVRVVASTNTSERGIDAELPSREAIERYRRVFMTGEKVEARSRPQARNAGAARDSSLLLTILGPALPPTGEPGSDDRPVPRLIRGRFYVYRYRAEDRTHGRDHDHPPGTTHSASDQPLCGTPPTLPLPPVDDAIKEGRWYVVAELIFRLPIAGSRMNWRALVEVETNSVLYLRALTSGQNGLVFVYDPITSTGTATNTPDQSSAVLNPFRDDVPLDNLDPPVAGTQSLTGIYANVANVSLPTPVVPTQPAGNDFDYDVRTDDFAAVNAYYHTDRFFQLVVDDLGFGLGYFDGTSLPIEDDHRGLGSVINAQCVGDGDGIDFAQYALADTADTVNPMGIAADWRVHLHELGGHGILYESTGSANFGFAHSAGDSFAVILNDYDSEWHNGAAIDRFILSPFVPAVPRRSDHDVATGWGWGGSSDIGGYPSEEILSTTMFRIYRSIGGDATSQTRREFCARVMAYLMLRAVGTLTAISNPSDPIGFANALIAVDLLDWTSEGVSGGAYGKVVRWAFEEQGLYQPVGAPTPVVTAGAPPDIDVYIDDGRAGEYEYLPVHWATTTIWKRRAADGLTTYEEPALGETNYAYVKIKNRGTQTANDVIVRGYHCRPSAGVLWPDDLQPFTTPELAAGTLGPDNTEEKTVGPFEWEPVENVWGHDCMLMIVSATGDPSNVDNFTAGDVVEDWRLVPNDNNVGQRNVTLVPGGGAIKGLVAGLHGKGFWVGNPGRSPAMVSATIVLPPLLVSRGWRVVLRDMPVGGIRLKPREQRLVTFDVRPGGAFTPADVRSASECGAANRVRGGRQSG